MIIASIDLQRGKAVQLRQGREKMLEKDDPLVLAAEFDRYGEVAVIDLDAALRQGDNETLLCSLLPLARCRVGGGIGSVEKAKQWLARGAEKIIIGSADFRPGGIDRLFLEQLAAVIDPQRIIIAIDARHGQIVSQGWRHDTGLDAQAAVGELEPFCAEFLFTCVEREGTLQGIDMEWVKRLRLASRRRLTVAGGVASLEEVRQLSGLGVDIQLGMALYTGRMTLAEAFVAAIDWRRPLLPTVVQDEAGRVLMLAHSNAESLQRSFFEGRMSYFSRSRRCLWRKGDTSGHFQELLRLRGDCDGDALLATVRPHGAACHDGRYSCFGDERFAWEDLFSVVGERLYGRGPAGRGAAAGGGAGSYTRSLTATRVRQKLMEEAAELILARGRDELVWEAADLLYFATVLLARRGIGAGDIMRELRRRRRP